MCRIRSIDTLRAQHPHRVPIVMAQHEGCPYTLDKTKYLVPDDLTAQQFLYVLRKRLRLRASEAMFLMCGASLVPGNATAQELHAKHADDEGVLRLTYSAENVFG